MCEECTFGVIEEDSDEQCRVTCPGCGVTVRRLFSRRGLWGVNCVSKHKLGNMNELTYPRLKDIDMKFENLKIIGDQIRETLNNVDNPRVEDNGQRTESSSTVDPRACDNVLGPRDLPGYARIEIKESKQGNTFFTASGDPIPHLGEKKVTIYTHG